MEIVRVSGIAVAIGGHRMVILAAVVASRGQRNVTVSVATGINIFTSCFSHSAIDEPSLCPGILLVITLLFFCDVRLIWPPSVFRHDWPSRSKADQPTDRPTD
ncbi:unnamed protein product [Soboliphyme baturini]|uniref:Transmembrane protein 107 n=1 Tax=Soboliphyme baturini TaxID=241478 RepID=A0A183J6Z5_9BILA|nr:unnamed protein product [Soboliphyme baturini]